MSQPTVGSTGTGSGPNSNKLTLRERLVPPMKSIGQGSNALQYHSPSPAWSVDFSRDGQWLSACYGAPDPCVRVWKITDSKPQQQNQKQQQQQQQWILHSTLEGIHARTIRSVAFCPLANPYILAAASFDGSVSIWEYSEKSNEWECTTQLEGHDHEIKDVKWNATGSLLATCGRDKTVWVWETWLDGSIGGSQMNEFECIAVLNGSEGDIKCIRFAPSHGQWGDGDEILISAGYDDTIRIWAEDAGDWYCAMSLDKIHADTIWGLAVSPSGGRLVSASADGSLAICKAYTAAERKEMEHLDGSTSVNGIWKCVGRLPEAHSSTIYSVDYAPAKAGHGRIASGGGDNRIQIYKEVMGSTSDQPMFTLDAAVGTNYGDVNCVRWHPWDGSTLCSAGDDGSVQLWHFEPS